MLKKLSIIPIAALALSAIGSGTAWALDHPTKPKPELNEAMAEKGKTIYFRRCSFCHGLLGDGNGPAADFLDPRPRDFTLGTFKFRTTQSGELPTDEDLFRTVSRGLPGTGMQAFDSDLIKNGLSEEERWAVVAYIKTFAQEFADPELDPYKVLVSLPKNMPPFSEEIVAKGKELFERAKCWECHGKQGRGDGQEAFDRTDDWGFPIRIRNVTHPWKIKGGTEVEDIFMRFSTGISGTPMPSFIKAFPKEEDRWYIANFIKSLQHKLKDKQVLKAQPVEGEVPDTPDDAAWESAETMDLRLAGQVHAAPRWQNPSIELVMMQALYNDKEIAFRLQWDDAFKDETHKQDLEFDPTDIKQVGAFNSYVMANDMIPRNLKNYRDSVALQFPVKLTEGTKKPHFMRGSSSNPVHLWFWKADLEAQGKRSVEEAIARGWKQNPKVQAEDQQQVVGNAVWAKGRWSLVMKRPLDTGNKNDIQFAAGKFIPVAINAWDGSNGEHGLIMSLSTWHYVFLEAPPPIKVYLYTVLATIITGGLGFWWMKRTEAEVEPEGEPEPATT